MTARKKLNVAFINGSVLLAGLIGYVCQSWIAFALALVLLLGMSIYAGDVRLKGGQGSNLRSAGAVR